MLSKCPICGKTFNDGRALHAHMLKSHLAEYRAADCSLEKMGVPENERVFGRFKAGDGKRHKPVRPSDLPEKPAGFRLLDPADAAESAARARGYTFVDGAENVYTIDEAKTKGWC